MANFNQVYAQFWVPSPPPQPTGTEFYWTGISNFTSSGALDWLLEPVLTWGTCTNVSDGSNCCPSDQSGCWTMSDWFYNGANSNLTSHSPQVPVSTGDHTYATIVELQGAPSVLYEVEWQDYPAGGGYLYYYWNIYVDSHPFSAAEPAVVEVANMVECNSMAASEYFAVEDIAYYQSGPSWNSYNDDGDTSANWEVDHIPWSGPFSNQVLQCDWTVINGDDCGPGYDPCSIIEWNASLCD